MPDDQLKNPKALFGAQSLVVLGNISVSAAILFIAAGWKSWLAGGLYILSYLLFNLISSYVEASKKPEKIALPEKGAIWDKVLHQIFRLMHPFTLILAGLEFRFFSPESLISPVLQVSGFVLLFVAFGLILWVQGTNPYYAYEIPQQDQWTQEIIDTGPYEFVRHPGNAGMLLLALVRPIVLGSFYGLLPAILGSFIVIVQTFLEDRALRAGVEGYQDYAAKTKYRLLEYIW